MTLPTPPIVTTAELRRLLDDAGGLWLVYAPDRAKFAAGHIPGSLAAPTAAMLVAVTGEARVVVYGEDHNAVAARALAADLSAAGVDAWWFCDGLAGWSAAGHAVEGPPTDDGRHR